MTVFRDKATGYYRYDFWLKGRRYQGRTKATTKTLAKAIEDAEKRKVVEGIWEVQSPRSSGTTVSMEADKRLDWYLATREPEDTSRFMEYAHKHIKEHIGDRFVSQFMADDVLRYQVKRLKPERQPRPLTLKSGS